MSVFEVMGEYIQPELDLVTLSASELQSLLSTQSLTSVDLVSQCLSQIALHDGETSSLPLRAMNTVAKRDHLMKVAKGLDKERRAGKLRGPLHGIPIVVKDMWQLHPESGVPCTAGMEALRSARHGGEGSALVKTLEEAGLIVLGSANMSEFGGGKATTTIGLSSVGGQCQSPYIPTGVIHGTPDLSHTQPGGSSTGSAVAVAAGYAPLSIATEASGSTTTPGARTALYALVMTRETIAMEGYLAISPTYASPGVMAKTVLDLRNLTVALLGASNAKEETLRMMPGVKEMMEGWEGVKVGAVSWDYDPIDLSETALSEEDILEEKETYEEALTKMRSLGAKVLYPIALPGNSDPIFAGPADDETAMCVPQNAIGTLISGEVRDDLNRYLKSLKSTPVRSLEELIRWNETHPEAQAGLDQTQFITAQESKLSKEEHRVLKEKMQKAAGRDTIDRVLKDLDIDVILGTMDMELVNLAALAGYPCATMPLGVFKSSGRPFGFAMLAGKHQEGKLLRVMGAHEGTFPARALPTMLLRAV